MKTVSLFLRALIGAVIVTLPLAAEAKPKKDESKKPDSEEGAEAQKKKKAQGSPRSAERDGGRPKAAAKSNGEKKSDSERRTASKPERSNPSGNGGQQRRAAAPEKPSKKATAETQNRRKAAPTQQLAVERGDDFESKARRELKQAKQQNPERTDANRRNAQVTQERRAENQEQIAEKKERRQARAADESEARAEKIAERRETRAESEQEKELRKNERAAREAAERADRKDARARTVEEKQERAENRADRREAREESAEERDRRAERARERQRIAQHRQRQINDRQERQRDRVERFRDNRRDRLAAITRQRRTIQTTHVETRREYVQEVRSEIRNYWDDRAEETRYRVGDRCDNLFDDNWWETRHWHRGPLLVSDPWWWWRPARFDAINVFLGAGWNEPVVYDYGTDVVYNDAVVHVRGEPVGSRSDYSRGVVRLANPVVATAAPAPLVESDWRSLGVWALVQEAQGDAVMFFQLSVDRQGLISGAYTNVVSGEELPVTGQVDRNTQRAAWHIGEQTEKVFEAGLANLTQEQASCLVHFQPGEMQTWLLVRLPDPSLPNQPASLSKASRGREVFALAGAMR